MQVLTSCKKTPDTLHPLEEYGAWRLELRSWLPNFITSEANVDAQHNTIQLRQESKGKPIR